MNQLVDEPTGQIRVHTGLVRLGSCNAVINRARLRDEGRESRDLPEADPPTVVSSTLKLMVALSAIHQCGPFLTTFSPPAAGLLLRHPGSHCSGGASLRPIEL